MPSQQPSAVPGDPSLPSAQVSTLVRQIAVTAKVQGGLDAATLSEQVTRLLAHWSEAQLVQVDPAPG